MGEAELPMDGTGLSGLAAGRRETANGSEEGESVKINKAVWDYS